MDILEVKNLTKKFSGSASGGSDFTVVDNISFSLKEGEILGLLGRNGAGKTTTIQLLLGLMQPTSGEILFFGKSFYQHREEILQYINFSSTYISMPWFFTVNEILDLYARLYVIPDKGRRIKKLLSEFELSHLAKKQFYMLSAGEKTRLLITKSFLNYPKIILLDEPTASLDVEIAVKIREFLKKEKREYNVSILLTSHNMAEVEEMCDRVMIIQKGKILAEDSPENLAKKIKHCELSLVITTGMEKAKKYFEEAKLPFLLDKHTFKIKIEENNVAHVLSALTLDHIGFEEISIDKPDLEDYFLEVVKQ